MPASRHLGRLFAEAAELVADELPEDQRPKYITNYIGSKQKLIDWIAALYGLSMDAEQHQFTPQRYWH